MGFAEWLKSLLGGAEKSPKAHAVAAQPKDWPPGLRRTLFVRSLDLDKTTKCLCEYGEMARSVWGLPEGIFEVSIFGPDPGWIAMAIPDQFPPFHFLNLVSWMTDAVDGDKEASFAGSVGLSVADGASPPWNCAFRTDAQFDGSVVTGVLANGCWFSTDLRTGSPRKSAQRMFQIDTGAPLESFMQQCRVPLRMWKDPGYWAYLAVARTERLA